MKDAIQVQADYNNSGMTTSQALEHALGNIQEFVYNELRAQGHSKFVAKILSKVAAKSNSYKMTIACDGGCKQTTVISKPLDDDGFWPDTGNWTSINGLDFCPQCLEDGHAQAALQAGAVPHDPRTFGGKGIQP
jgi:hypothetical protein